MNSRSITHFSRRLKFVLLLISGGLAFQFTQTVKTASLSDHAEAAQQTFKQYCVTCHGANSPKAGVSLTKLLASSDIGESFQTWEKVVAALEDKSMPPRAMPQPSDSERQQAVAWIRKSLSDYAKAHDGEPGHVTVRRLTSGEYAYAIEDLTGLTINTGIDSSSDTVGGEGFTNFGDVQFMQDANFERYLNAAKTVANHAVIGAGPLTFYRDPGKSGFEYSAVARLREMYEKYGIRAVSGEGGKPFGLERYSKAFYVAWRYKHRAALGEASATLPTIAAREGITPRLAQHIWSVVNKPGLSYPSSEVVARWQKLPAPSAQPDDKAIRAACDEIQKYAVTWPSWLFARGDLAAGGAGDESPLEFSDRTLNLKDKHRFVYVRGSSRDPVQPGPAKIYLNVANVHPMMGDKPVVIWRNITVGYRPIVPRGPVAAGESFVVTAADAEITANIRKGIPPPGERKKLKDLVSPETAAQLNFGKNIDGTPIGENDFVSVGSTMFEIPMPESKQPQLMNLLIDVELGANRDQVIRIVVSDRADGQTRGQPTRALIGDMASAGYKAFRKGVDEYASLLPPNSHSEPTPADKDPVPEPFDNTYNVPEHDEFVVKVKYIRDDKFFAENLIDAPTRRKLDQAWNDLWSSFEYHNNYLRLLAKHYNFDLQGRDITQMDKAGIATLPAAMQPYVRSLRAHYNDVQAALKAGQPGHVTDCLEFASKAWRRPLTEAEKLNLRAFYDKTRAAENDHRKAIRALITRILVAPQFLYRIEQGDPSAVGITPVSFVNQPNVVPLTNWEMASRLSFFLWSSLPDDELRRAASAGELTSEPGIQKQVKRMLADAKARRLSTEFFGQWLGFYHFNEFKGVDTARFPEFTDEIKQAMYDEAITFFEHIIRQERPISELFEADYTFLNQDLAKFYGIKQEVKAKDRVELVEGARALQRGGMLRLGALLTVTSAPLRTSPVKRGDWLLRRILNTPTPPPPGDAGSLPADEKQFGGLTLKAKLEQHKRNPTCFNCHSRIDPLGFAFERYDSVGRWREKYNNGQAIEDSATLPDKTEIAGLDGLLRYLKNKDAQVRKTLSYKLVGYALGRTVTAADQALIERMTAQGSTATFTQLATEIATSKQFRNRAAREEAPKRAAQTAMK